jgi:hypothetical protein
MLPNEGVSRFLARKNELEKYFSTFRLALKMTCRYSVSYNISLTTSSVGSLNEQQVNNRPARVYPRP